jgi:hypothetical protein
VDPNEVSSFMASEVASGLEIDDQDSILDDYFDNISF